MGISVCVQVVLDISFVVGVARAEDAKAVSPKSVWSRMRTRWWVSSPSSTRVSSTREFYSGELGRSLIAELPHEIAELLRNGLEWETQTMDARWNGKCARIIPTSTRL